MHNLCSWNLRFNFSIAMTMMGESRVSLLIYRLVSRLEIQRPYCDVTLWNGLFNSRTPFTSVNPSAAELVSCFQGPASVSYLSKKC